MIDIKEQYSIRAEELAYERFGKEFYDLTDEQQLKVYGDAEQDVWDDLMTDAENQLDEMRLTMTEDEIDKFLQRGDDK